MQQKNIIPGKMASWLMTDAGEQGQQQFDAVHILRF